MTDLLDAWNRRATTDAELCVSFSKDDGISRYTETDAYIPPTFKLDHGKLCGIEIFQHFSWKF